MAEVKNAFIKSKMNKDLDDRLLPNGEYRDALNVQISKSEASDVGALENVIGNSLIKNFATLVSAPDIKCIGYFTDEFKVDIYAFFTDFTDSNTGAEQGYSTTAKNFIFKHNIPGDDTRLLVTGAFLNFSTTSPIIGINLLEDLLFFTDNRNQPRKINVINANTTEDNIIPTYYTNEDQISVAKYNPYECIRVVSTTDTTVTELAGALVLSVKLNGASNTKVLTVFSTTNVTAGMGVTGPGVKTNTFVVGISGNDITTNKVQNLASGVDVVFAPLQTTMQDVSTVLLPDGTANPYRDADFGGDPDFLEDKFVRFSYRFQFDDGENSIFAPFTQPCFIPKQDGYFIGDDEKDTFSSTIVGFMENKVTKIQLQIPLPANGDLLVGNDSPYKITAIDILYKESDGLAVQVVDTIPIDDAFNTKTGSNNIYQYDYESTKPFKTLPSKELIRVYDKIPVKAFSQEIISNRVVYGNFQDKHTPPEALDYQVAVSDKFSKSSLFSNKTIVEYPNSSVKQNRNYQVGIVLSDKFGRQSSTLLSNNTSPLTATGFGASTVFSPYQTALDTPPPTWPGDSLKVLFNGPITSEINSLTGTPGLYNGDPISADYNPLGWFSYKVVVQQKEQDYYNVYNAGAMKGNPLSIGEDLNTSYISLLNDNINKVPRDLSEVGPLQKQFRSSVRLIGRVENTQYATTALGNKQFYPGRLTDTTSSIEDLNSLFDVSSFEDNSSSTPPIKPAITSNKNAYSPFYKAESDPLIAQITTTQSFGLVNTASQSTPSVYAAIENLTIFETEPDLSRLDFYFETSTSGLISELNLAVNTDTGGAFGLRNFNLNQNEGMGLGVDVTTDFVPTDITDADIDVSNIVLTSVTDNTGSGFNRRLEWSLIKDAGATPNSYKLRTATTPSLGYQYYGGTPANRNYTFKFAVTADGATNNIIVTGALSNIAPTIGGGSPQAILVTGGTTGVISTQTAVNGVNTGSNLQLNDLTWDKVDPSIAGNLTINPSNGQVSNSSSSTGGTQTIDVRVTDAGGLTAVATLNFTFGNAPVPSRFTIPEVFLTDGEMITYYFTDPTTNSFSNLDNNNHVIASGFRQSNASSSTPTTAANSKSGFVCSTPNKYEWKKQYKGQWLEGANDAAFFVALRNQCKSQGTTGTSASVEYRNINSATTDWVQAFDINGQAAKFGMVQTSPGVFNQVRYNTAGTMTTVQIPAPDPSFLPQTDYGINVSSGAGGSQSGYRIFAFNGTNFDGSSDTDGEYRITMGNFQGTNLSYIGPGSCGGTEQTLKGTQGIELGDASYGQPGGSTPAPSSYQYRISVNTTTSCGDSGITFNGTNGTNVYAREFIAKYVTQLYTDAALTTKLTTNAGSHSFGRIGSGGNLEGTLNGLYISSFNSTGFRTQGKDNASIACTLS